MKEENMNLFERLFKGLKDVVTMPIREQSIKGKLFTSYMSAKTQKDEAESMKNNIYIKLVEDKADAATINEAVKLKATIEGADNTMRYVQEIHEELFNKPMKTEL